MTDRQIRRAWILAVIVAVIATAAAGYFVTLPSVQRVIHPPPDTPETIGTDCVRGDASACRDLCRALAKVSDLRECGIRHLPTAPRGAQGPNGPKPRLEITTARHGPGASSSSPTSPSSPAAPSLTPPEPSPGNGDGNGSPGPSPGPSPPPAPPPGTTPTPPPSPPPGGSPGGAVERTIGHVRTTVCPNLPPLAHGNPVCP